MIKVEKLNKEYTIKKRYGNLREYMKEMTFKKKEVIHAVTDLSFEIAQGEMVGFIGPNGAGKSTTIKMLTGIITPTSGVIDINGLSPSNNRKKYVKDIGVVFGQRSQLWWDLPVIDSFLLLKDIYKVPEKNYKKNMELFDDLLELHKIIYRPVRQLSLGQRMRCEIAASFIHDPKIVYLDEPTIGLDIISKEGIREIIKYLNMEKKCTVILTTHDMSDIEDLCKRIMIINEGKLVFDSSIQEIKLMGNQNKYMTVDMKDDININHEYIQVIEDEGKRKKIMFDHNIISTQCVIQELMSVTDIVNLDIHGKQIEEIIKEIYVGNDMTNIGKNK